MTQTHSVHKEIGEAVFNKFRNIPGVQILRDPACGGEHNLPLFYDSNKEKSAKTEFCDVDMLIIKDDKVKVIFEIEESNIKPTQICGKFLTSALSSYYCYKREQKHLIDDNILFIQVVDTLKLKENSSKSDQFNNIKSAIGQGITLKDNKKVGYRLIKTKEKGFNQELIMQIEEFIGGGK